MSELASYSIQAVFFALVAVVVVSRSKKTDLYQFSLISIWLIGVIAIYAKYKDGQIFFYSNDQDFHRQVIEYYLPVEGFHVSAIISLRYLLTIPVYLVSLLGFNAMLIIKFLQLSALLFVYQRSRKFLAAQLLSVKFWQLPLIAGPILVFMSLLSLRDVLLAYFALGFVTESQLNRKIVFGIATLLLRTHLAAALIVGYLLVSIFFSHKSKIGAARICGIALLSYIAGTVSYWIGAVIQKGVNFDAPRTVFTQFKFSQLAANFFGLQFLALSNPDDRIVASSTLTLLLSRLVFFDTLLIPMLFLIAVFKHPMYLTTQKILTLQAFLFFYGVVSQTSYNSTRQNIPFLACMGVLAVADIEHFRKIKAKVAPKLLIATR